MGAASGAASGVASGVASGATRGAARRERIAAQEVVAAPVSSPLSASTLVRRLARLRGLEAGASVGDAGERLGRWLSWTDAISLSTTLGTTPAPMPAAFPVDAAAVAREAAELARVRDALARAVSAPMPDSGVAAASGDFTPYRRQIHQRQQACVRQLEPLRQRLRLRLSESGPAGARLAALDAAMEPLLAPRERTLLAAVPAWLERRFDALRRAASADASAWRDTFRRELVDVLAAELEFRLQPCEGLLAALRAQVAG